MGMGNLNIVKFVSFYLVNYCHTQLNYSLLVKMECNRDELCLN